MNRKSFISNTLLAICSTILPEILRPMEGVVKDDGVWYDMPLPKTFKEIQMLNDEYPKWAYYYYVDEEYIELIESNEPITATITIKS